MPMERAYVQHTRSFARVISFANHVPIESFSNNVEGRKQAYDLCTEINNSSHRDDNSAIIINHLKKLGKPIPKNFKIIRHPIETRITKKNLLPKPVIKREKSYG